MDGSAFRAARIDGSDEQTSARDGQAVPESVALGGFRAHDGAGLHPRSAVVFVDEDAPARDPRAVRLSDKDFAAGDRDRSSEALRQCAGRHETEDGDAQKRNERRSFHLLFPLSNTD